MYLTLIGIKIVYCY